MAKPPVKRKSPQLLALGKRLREARRQAGYHTIRAFADDHNMPSSTYTQYEIGDREPSIENLLRFTEAFETNLIWLLTGKGERTVKEDDLVSFINQDGLEGVDIVTIPCSGDSFDSDALALIGGTIARTLEEEQVHLDMRTILKLAINIYSEILTQRSKLEVPI